MYILILMAMEEELHYVKKQIDVEETIQFLDYIFFIGTINNKKIILSQGGIGKVNITIGLTWLLNNFKNIKYIINAGSAGGIKCNKGDIILAKRCIYYDVDLTNFNYAFGQHVGCPKYFACNKKLLNRFYKVLSPSFNVYLSTVASGDSFLSNNNQLSKVCEEYDDIKAIDMEAAAIAHVCYKYNKDLIVIKYITDLVNNNSTEDFHYNLSSASLYLTDTILKCL